MIVYSYRALNLIPSHKKRGKPKKELNSVGFTIAPGMEYYDHVHCIKLIWLKVDLALWKNVTNRQLGWFSIPNCFWKVIKFHGSSHHQPVIELGCPKISPLSDRPPAFSVMAVDNPPWFCNWNSPIFFGGMCNLPRLITGEYHQFHAVSPWIFPVLSPSKRWLNHEKSPFPMIIPWNVP